MNQTDQAIQFIQQTDWADLPPAVQHLAKRCLLDTLGSQLAGMLTPVASPARRRPQRVGR